MDRSTTYALDAAKEITIARVSNATTVPNKDAGEQVADFYEEIFNRIKKIAQEAE